jgi:hypothetical protein
LHRRAHPSAQAGSTTRSELAASLAPEDDVIEGKFACFRSRNTADRALASARPGLLEAGAVD